MLHIVSIHHQAHCIFRLVYLLAQVKNYGSDGIVGGFHLRYCRFVGHTRRFQFAHGADGLCPCALRLLGGSELGIEHKESVVGVRHTGDECASRCLLIVEHLRLGGFCTAQVIERPTEDVKLPRGGGYQVVGAVAYPSLRGEARRGGERHRRHIR